ncbi:hypothetical protein [Caulobacter sp. Root487D2Y]|uniref:hypothetical protein n=1 Tax=Caulobacter sp. Root487D2Y TaxID=1736547 RepID=UPI0012E35FAC|nr:hypothetical protein [Caulobacter sp. Root487D2Y]
MASQFLFSTLSGPWRGHLTDLTSLMSQALKRVPLEVSSSNSIVAFQRVGGGAWAEWDRYLTIDGKSAYNLGNICGTCAFLFERMDGANRAVSVESLVENLSKGVNDLDDALIKTLAELMPVSRYEVCLFSFTPQLVTPGSSGDYFAVEQVENQGGVDGFWGLPHHPKVPYYRPVERLEGEIPSGDGAKIFDFLIPMFPETWLNDGRVEHYLSVLESDRQPTAVAISVLDVKGPADGGADHWCMAHYILDGHHKIAAAARAGKPVSLIAFIAVDHGISSAEQLNTALGTY